MTNDEDTNCIKKKIITICGIKFTLPCKKREVVGYTTGVYDLFHIGHLNLLKNAKNY